ncbi:MAG: putative porin [Sphingobacteriales bacterium]
MHHKLKYLLILLIALIAQGAFAQLPGQPGYGQTGQPGYNNGQQISPFADTARRQAKHLTADQEIDTLRKQEEAKRDSVIFTNKFVKVTNERLLRDSTQVFPLDTTINNFENYSALYQPNDPKISLGHLGLDARDLLYEPSKTIGFDVGQHSLDLYVLHPEDINYYNTRVPYTVLSLVTGGTKEQVVKILHTQNIKPNWNMGFNLNFLGSRGFYSTNGVLAQNVSNINAALFSWYQSKSRRYNMLANIMLNNIKAPETGGLSKGYNNVFTQSVLDKTTIPVNLPRTYENWRDNGLYVKQFYYIGHVDTVEKGGDTAKVVPTQRIAYTFHYNVQTYEFLQNDQDTAHVFPDYYFSSNRSRDSLSVHHLQNDFAYSFALRSRAAKNVIKLDVGLTQDFYQYTQSVSDSIVNKYGIQVVHADHLQTNSFEDLTLKGRLGYSFSNRAAFEANVNQIVQGRDFGDFLYDFKLMLAGNNKAGKIILNAYTQSSSPPLVYTSWISNHYIFHNSFSNQKTNSASFNYINNALQLDLKAEYFLLTDYLYFTADANSNDAHPTQLSSPISLLKVTLSKNLEWRRWHFNNTIVYQKTDNQSTLRTPDLYTYSSLYYSKLLFNVLNTSIGTDVRYNTSYLAPSYAVGLGQFYNGPDVTFSSYPKATVFIKATLMHTNLFVMYDYANQGLFSKGFYTVNRYPMEDAQLKFGISWTFFN